LNLAKFGTKTIIGGGGGGGVLSLQISFHFWRAKLQLSSWYGCAAL
jgi:hypothetical protein